MNRLVEALHRACRNSNSEAVWVRTPVSEGVYVRLYCRHSEPTAEPNVMQNIFQSHYLDFWNISNNNFLYEMCFYTNYQYKYTFFLKRISNTLQYYSRSISRLYVSYIQSLASVIHVSTEIIIEIIDVCGSSSVCIRQRSNSSIFIILFIGF